MAKGIRCLDKKYLSTIVRDLHLESHEQYREFHRKGLFHGWLPSNLYNYIKVKGVFGNCDYVSLDTLVNIWSHLRSENLLRDFQTRHPDFLPSNWEEYYGVTIEDLSSVIDLYPEIDMHQLIEIIHPTNVEVSEVDKKYYKDADPENFFREDLSTYKKVVESVLESLESLESNDKKNFSIESVLGPNEKWKRDSIKNYLILDGIAIDSDSEVEIIASIDEVKFIMGMLNGGTHPIHKGLEGYFTYDSHEARLAEHHRVMSAASEFNVRHGDKVKDEFNDEFFNEIAMELEKEPIDEPSNEMNEVENASPNEWEVHLDGLVILLPRSSNKKIRVDGNKIIIQ